MINYPLDNDTTESVLKVETMSGGKSFQQEFVSSQPTYNCINCDVNFIPEEQVCDCIGQPPTPSLKNTYHDTMSMNKKQTAISDVKEKAFMYSYAPIRISQYSYKYKENHLGT